ncbi:MAG: hypothetical protein KKC72_14530 [Alphaproteobacteria bacterium]|nr:hypothetical protein [Alphaproteobacteria bacterium]MBU1835044.1 hypothetical protein [Alphaproteobacteria bacterium]
MSLILKMVRAFPRGRSTEELLVLVGAGFSHDKRLAAIAELEQLLQDGLVEKGRDGRWRAKRELPVNIGQIGKKTNLPSGVASEDVIHAAAATFNLEPLANQQFDTEDLGNEHLDPQALLRYWRSALRADPRGATCPSSNDLEQAA